MRKSLIVSWKLARPKRCTDSSLLAAGHGRVQNLYAPAPTHLATNGHIQQAQLHVHSWSQVPPTPQSG